MEHMGFEAWLDAERGRGKALADHMGVTEGRVSQWKKEGVPAEHMRAVRDFSGGVVTLESMLPKPKPKSLAASGEHAQALDLYVRNGEGVSPDTRHPENLGRVWVAVPRRRAEDKPNAASERGGC